MEPFLADFINNEKIPRIIRYTIVCLLCSFIIFLGVSISINSELLFGKIFGIILSIVFLFFGIYLIVKINKSRTKI